MNKGYRFCLVYLKEDIKIVWKGYTVFLQKLENRRTNGQRVVWTQYSPLNRRRRGQDKREQSSWQTFSRTNLTCFTASSLKQAFASEMDEVRQAKYLRLSVVWLSYWRLIHHCLRWAALPSLGSRTEQLPTSPQPFRQQRCTENRHLFLCCLCWTHLRSLPQYQPCICLLPSGCTWQQTFPPLNPAPKNNHTLLYPG